MWDHQCVETTHKGERCKRESRHAVWRFDGDDKSPSWWEYCGHHINFSGQVSYLAIARKR